MASDLGTFHHDFNNRKLESSTALGCSLLAWTKSADSCNCWKEMCWNIFNPIAWFFAVCLVVNAKNAEFDEFVFWLISWFRGIIDIQYTICPRWGGNWHSSKEFSFLLRDILSISMTIGRRVILVDACEFLNVTCDTPLRQGILVPTSGTDSEESSAVKVWIWVLTSVQASLWTYWDVQYSNSVVLWMLGTLR